jgi:hypothetical protein
MKKPKTIYEMIRTCMDCPPPTRENPTSNIIGCVDEQRDLTLTCKKHCNDPDGCSILKTADQREVTSTICDECLMVIVEKKRISRNGVK